MDRMTGASAWQLILNAEWPALPCPDVFYLENSPLMWNLQKFSHFEKTAVQSIDAEPILLVIESANIEKSMSFYSAFGLSFRQERHGKGPAAY